MCDIRFDGNFLNFSCLFYFWRDKYQQHNKVVSKMFVLVSLETLSRETSCPMNDDEQLPNSVISDSDSHCSSLNGVLLGQFCRLNSPNKQNIKRKSQTRCNFSTLLFCFLLVNFHTFIKSSSFSWLIIGFHEVISQYHQFYSIVSWEVPYFLDSKTLIKSI